MLGTLVKQLIEGIEKAYQSSLRPHSHCCCLTTCWNVDRLGRAVACIQWTEKEDRKQ